jgi:dTDP-4-amino-4,6-dideoxygalactose transaminase
MAKLISHSKPLIDYRDKRSILKVLESEFVATGSVTHEFESQLGKFLGSEKVKFLPSGTKSINLALQLLNVKQNDEVIIPNYICQNVLLAASQLGAKVIIVDVNEYGVLTKQSIRSSITNKTKAVIAAHMYGNICDIDELKEFGIPILEDACHAFGSNYKNRKIGTFGDIGIFSFNATKLLTTGEGGALVTNNQKFIDTIDYNSTWKTFYPMSDIGAALGLSQLSKFAEFVKKRKYLFAIFNEKLSYLGISLALSNQVDIPFRLPLLSKKNFSVIESRFMKKGIVVRRGVDSLLHRQQNLSDSKFQNSVHLYNSIVSLPFYPALTNWEIKKIVRNLDLIISDD